jgi:hypothetical protein
VGTVHVEIIDITAFAFDEAYVLIASYWFANPISCNENLIKIDDRQISVSSNATAVNIQSMHRPEHVDTQLYVPSIHQLSLSVAS